MELKWKREAGKQQRIRWIGWQCRIYTIARGQHRVAVGRLVHCDSTWPPEVGGRWAKEEEDEFISSQSSVSKSAHYPCLPASFCMCLCPCIYLYSCQCIYAYVLSLVVCICASAFVPVSLFVFMRFHCLSFQCSLPSHALVQNNRASDLLTITARINESSLYSFVFLFVSLWPSDRPTLFYFCMYIRMYICTLRWLYSCI